MDSQNVKNLSYKASVLVLGESQNGKSTFIKMLFTVAGLPIPDTLEVGKGGIATTLSPHVYDITIPMYVLDLKEKEKDDSIDTSKVFQDPELFEDYVDRPDMRVIRNEKVATINLKIIDTPGLKGTDQNDERTVYEVLQKLAEIEDINSIVLVNKGTNYGPSFQESLGYYLAVFGQTFPVDMFHTKYSAEDLLADLENKAEFPNVPRVTEFKTVFKHLTHVQHWLIDSEPRKNRPFREFLSLDTIYRWLISLETKQGVPLQVFEFIKTQKMISLDRRLKDWNNALAIGHTRGISERENFITVVTEKLLDLKLQIETLQTELSFLKGQLIKLDSDENIHLKTESVASAWGLDTPKFPINLTMDFPITEVIKSAESPFTNWKNEKFDGDRKSYSVDFIAPLLRGTYGSVSLYTASKYFNSHQIIKLAKEIQTREKKVEQLEIEHSELLEKHFELDNEIQGLEAMQNFYTRTNSALSEQKIPIPFFLEVWPTYEKLLEKDDDDLFAQLNQSYFNFLLSNEVEVDTSSLEEKSKKSSHKKLQAEETKECFQSESNNLPEEVFNTISEICTGKTLPKNFTLQELKALDKIIKENSFFPEEYYRRFLLVTSPFRKTEELKVSYDVEARVEAEKVDKVPSHLVTFKTHFMRGPYSHLFLTSVNIPKNALLVQTVKFDGDLYDQKWGNSGYSGLVCYTTTPQTSFFEDILVIDHNQKKERHHTIIFDEQNLLKLQQIPIQDSKLEFYLCSPPFPGFIAETKGFELTFTFITDEYIE